MTKEYIGSLGNRHNLTKYTLSNGVEVILNEQEEEELFEELELNSKYISDLENKVEVLETKLEKYQEIVKTFKSFQKQLEKVKC